MRISISLPDSLRSFLEAQMQERGESSLDQCVSSLLESVRQSQPPRRVLKVDGQTYRLTRLSPRRRGDIWSSAIAIEDDHLFQLGLHQSSSLGLAETYAVCRHLFGERGREFDDWKGGFAFPLGLEVPRSDRRPAYLFHVTNYRSGVDYRPHKVVDPSDQRLNSRIYYPPEDAEFSRAEINHFMAFFTGYLEGRFESLQAVWEDRFLLAVQSNLILFGFDGETFFHRQFESPEEFVDARDELARHLPEPGYYARD